LTVACREISNACLDSGNQKFRVGFVFVGAQKIQGVRCEDNEDEDENRKERSKDIFT